MTEFKSSTKEKLFILTKLSSMQSVQDKNTWEDNLSEGKFVKSINNHLETGFGKEISKTSRNSKSTEAAINELINSIENICVTLDDFYELSTKDFGKKIGLDEQFVRHLCDLYYTKITPSFPIFSNSYKSAEKIFKDGISFFKLYYLLYEDRKLKVASCPLIIRSIVGNTKYDRAESCRLRCIMSIKPFFYRKNIKTDEEIMFWYDGFLSIQNWNNWYWAFTLRKTISEYEDVLEKVARDMIFLSTDNCKEQDLASGRIMLDQHGTQGELMTDHRFVDKAVIKKDKRFMNKIMNTYDFNNVKEDNREKFKDKFHLFKFINEDDKSEIYEDLQNSFLKECEIMSITEASIKHQDVLDILLWRRHLTALS